MGRIDAIAEFLNVSPNYLLRGVDDEVNMETMSEAEIQLVKRYRRADEKGKEFVMQAAEYVTRTLSSVP